MKNRIFHTYSAYVLILIILFGGSCGEDQMLTNEPIVPVETPISAANNIVPLPVSVTIEEGVFEITSDVIVSSNGFSEKLDDQGQNLVDLLNQSSIFNASFTNAEMAPSAGKIYLEVRENQAEIGDEGYHLEINSNNVIISANSESGIFYGIQTLLQILSPEVRSGRAQMIESMTIPAVRIIDYPRYEYRSSMIDVARHFFSVEDVKRYIDLISIYKMNYLHLHLSDDQGWRIEIKSWPELTTIGGSTKVGGGLGGYYTQEDFKEIVDYASKRYITIIPEIDMPGHTNAALASYPELNCSGIAPELYTGTSVGISTLCLEKELTYQFAEDVIREISLITPGDYFHIGGDEVPGGTSNIYNEFITRIKEIVNQNGKTMIGWDEIGTSEINQDDVVQFWLNGNNVELARNKRARIIYSPFNQSYLNLRYNSSITVGASFNSFLSVPQSYNWDPTTLLNNQISDNEIWGLEAPVWTEEITNIDEIEFMTFPRLPGIAEIGWSKMNQRNWESYRNRLAAQQERFEELDINYFRSNLVPWKQ